MISKVGLWRKTWHFSSPPHACINTSFSPSNLNESKHSWRLLWIMTILTRTVLGWSLSWNEGNQRCITEAPLSKTTPSHCPNSFWPPPPLLCQTGTLFFTWMGFQINSRELTWTYNLADGHIPGPCGCYASLRGERLTSESESESAIQGPILDSFLTVFVSVTWVNQVLNCILAVYR